MGEIQRARILTAMTEAVAQRGVAGATVAQVVERSGISRRTFYELFEDREDCFMAAFDHALTLAAETVIPACRQVRGWREGMRAGLIALLEFLEREPDMACLCVVEAVAAGERPRERRREVLQALAAAIDEGRETTRAGREPPPLAAEGVVGAVLGVIHARILGPARTPRDRPASRRTPLRTSGAPGSLLELVNPLMATIVMPYLGLAAAQRELTRTTPSPAGSSPRLHSDPLKELDMRLTYRTVRVLLAVGQAPGASNREVADHAGVADQGQISKLLTRLQSLGLVQNTGAGPAKGEPNAWTLTTKGLDLQHVLHAQTHANH